LQPRLDHRLKKLCLILLASKEIELDLSTWQLQQAFDLRKLLEEPHCGEAVREDGKYDRSRSAQALRDLVHRSVADQVAPLDDSDRVAEASQFGEDVGGNDYDLAHIAELDDKVFQLSPSSGVEAARRLVEKEEIGVVYQTPGKTQALLHAARESLDERISLHG